MLNKNKLLSPSYIVCAALLKDGVIIAGPRHFDSVMRSQINAIRKPGEGVGIFAGAEQGFVDQFGTFYNRIEAMDIVKANGQAFDRKRNGQGDVLYSEGLY